MRSGVFVALLGLALASPALAQSTSAPAAGAGTMTGPPTAGAPTPGAPTDLDLPLEKPVCIAPTPTPTPPGPPPTPDDGDRDDPRDEPPPVIYGEEITSENDTIVYVLDRSGSMDWDDASFTDLDGNRRTGNRMERAKVELSRSIQGLSRNFRFNVIAFDCATHQWQRRLQEANDTNKAAALAWVRRLSPGGATGTGPAVALALYSDRDNKSVVLLTDGEPNCGLDDGNDFSLEAHRRVIRNENTQRAVINVFGIAARGQWRRFCQNVAADSGGSYFDVP
ncbi:MAG: VWA domain-containing protein [Planctomycetota bacterium]|nr:VWA domain-containing protein [Planctomycetota bacterium]